MMLTAKSRYAVTAIVDIASYEGLGPVTLAEISGRSSISTNYLEQIFFKLKKAGLVKAVKGPGGGYLMAESLDKVKISYIIAAVEENIEMTGCSMKKTSKKLCSSALGKKCRTHNLWQGLSDRIRDYFAGISLLDLVEGEKRL